MILHIPLVTLLNATLAATATLECWAQNPSNESQLLPVIYKECRETVLSIYLGQKALAPIVFGRSPDAGFQVPHTWDYGSCEVVIDVREEGLWETETFAAILKRAFNLAIECVIKAPHLGGRSFLGREEGLQVSMYGVPGGRRNGFSVDDS